MRKWATITIFLTAVVFGAAAQQPSKSQTAIMNPGEPSTLASKKPVLPELTGATRSPDPLPRPDLKKPTEDLTEYQRELIEGHNQELKEHFTAQQHAGGWQRVFLKQLALQRLEVPKATLQLDAAQRFITDFVFCERPLIAGQASDFQAFAKSFRQGTRNAEFALEPRASIIVNGCSFGQDAGELRLILNHDAGNFIALQLNDWSDSSIFATLETTPAIPDQEVQLVVVRKDGTQSVPMTVEFFQHRAAHVFKVPGHLDELRVASSSHLTE
jgi:hypothetical protein